MWEAIHRELVYLWYYTDVQLRQIFWYWVLGIVVGSVISVFVKSRLHAFCERIGARLSGVAGWVLGSLLGIASPLCMYGTIPICASFSQKGIKEDFLASFMMSSMLLNPQLIMYSMALGWKVLVLRIASCFLCGVAAGGLIHAAYCKRNYKYFNFNSLYEPCNRDTDPRWWLRLLKNIGRNLKATGPWFLLGILLSALFQIHVPPEAVGRLFGRHEGFGVLLAATVGVPLYVCGGGTIPLLRQWLAEGMSLGSATAFMLTGPATKITNLGALKIALGAKHFGLYLAFVLLFSLLTGLLVNLLLCP